LRPDELDKERVALGFSIGPDAPRRRAWQNFRRPIEKCRFAGDSPLEGGGFELSVPRCEWASNRARQEFCAICLLCGPSDSPLEGDGFETSVRHRIDPSGGTRRFHGENPRTKAQNRRQSHTEPGDRMQLSFSRLPMDKITGLDARF
jgi:hypothetical protein